MRSKLAGDDLAMLGLKAVITLSAIEAIAIGSFPVPTLAMVAAVVLAVWVNAKFKAVPAVLYILTAWAVIVQFISSACQITQACEQMAMPPLSTTPYPIFIALRLLPFAMFVAVIALMGKLEGRREEILRFIVNIGVIISIIALYVYAAQLTGLPDIPRTRLGTDGLEVKEVKFSYAFHRAVGTFREPASLSSWLILPMCLSLIKLSWRTCVIGVVILLSGSMTTYVSLAIGLIFSIIFVALRRVDNKVWLLRIPVTIFVTLSVIVLLFQMLVGGNAEFRGLGSVVADRVLPVLTGGVGESNRGYVYDFAAIVGVPVFGYGLGNINLMLSSWMGSQAVSGILSLYINIVMSLGIFGGILLAILLVSPLLKRFDEGSIKIIYAIISAYFAWLVAFIVHSAEFSIIFAVTFGLVLSIAPGKLTRTSHYRFT